MLSFMLIMEILNMLVKNLYVQNSMLYWPDIYAHFKFSNFIEEYLYQCAPLFKFQNLKNKLKKKSEQSQHLKCGYVQPTYNICCIFS